MKLNHGLGHFTRMANRPIETVPPIIAGFMERKTKNQNKHIFRISYVSFLNISKCVQY